MSNSLTFELPLPDNIANGRMHWRVKAKSKTAYYDKLDAFVWGELLPRKPSKPILTPAATIAMRTVRRMDHDNAHARLKWVLDWLQTRGYIANDRDLTYTLATSTAPRKNVGITLILTEGPA